MLIFILQYHVQNSNTNYCSGYSIENSNSSDHHSCTVPITNQFNILVLVFNVNVLIATSELA